MYYLFHTLITCFTIYAFMKLGSTLNETLDKKRWFDICLISFNFLQFIYGNFVCYISTASFTFIYFYFFLDIAYVCYEKET